MGRLLNLIITKLNGTTYDLEALGITLKEFKPRSPSPIHSSESIEGAQGEVDLGTVYGPRIIDCSFYMKAADLTDYHLMRDEVFALFDSRQAFYITDGYNPGKRWFVKTNQEYSIDQNRIYGFFDISFISFKPFSESIGTTLSPFTFDSDLWQIGEGLTDEDYKYSFKTNTFRVFNAGTEEIDPRELPLIITYKGASSKLTITNSTMGDVFQYSGTTGAKDVLSLNRVQVKKNNVSVFGQTNRKVIRLAPGWNDFKMAGTSGSFEIKFDFRFYYL
ncbi:phage tail family protein [Bacillus halotolerans]|uniref:phage tail family protein n=1 Tax=Bacillus halotolerans TaxID=260554 RepID=UPI0022820745|nr:phage tail family protein [Bacillus halotolerans]MCY8472456.1 phage tail family protein [Bacillus halotolerans]